MNPIKKISILTALVLFLAACSSKTEKQGNKAPVPATASITETATPVAGNYKKGDPVPPNLVCMVNDAFMGKEQLAVPLNGKTYYGCCEMCKSRIPNDPSVRKATDPQSGKTIDKATAYIVMTGAEGAVTYFENEQSYKNFIEK
ncbi:hypothetical protein [Niabella soli]|uniref:MlpB protein n=1 Tax=Niabella soli DSM 19437 TaxID=929713 RepID=W0F695_9BACT|nr:hypothetical protein [Niabella soli]AHF16979.1 MlpB protein [Niabella soli DSM 19437]